MQGTAIASRDAVERLLNIPHDRQETFELHRATRRQRRLPGFNHNVIIMYAHCMNVREIQKAASSGDPLQYPGPRGRAVLCTREFWTTPAPVGDPAGR